MGKQDVSKAKLQAVSGGREWGWSGGGRVGHGN